MQVKVILKLLELKLGLKKNKKKKLKIKVDFVFTFKPFLKIFLIFSLIFAPEKEKN